MKKPLIILGLIFVFTLLISASRVFATHVEPNIPVCETTCPVVHFEWDDYLDCPEGYKVKNGDKCEKKHDPDKGSFIDRQFVHKTADVQYEKSQDPNHCHRPSDNTLEDVYDMDHDARQAFKQDNSELKDSIQSFCPTPTLTSTPTLTPTPTEEVTPTITPTPTDDPQCDEDDCEVVTPTPTPNPCDEVQGPPVKFDIVLQPCVTPTDEPTPTPTPTDEPHNDAGPQTSVSDPACGAANITQGVDNPHVYRKGDDAIIKWWPTAGKTVHIYYKENSASDWQFSFTQDNTGNAEVHGLGNLDITFAIQQVNDCGGGVLSTPIIDGNTSGWVLFR